jgi:hypothetical protein
MEEENAVFGNRGPEENDEDVNIRFKAYDDVAMLGIIYYV